MTHWVQTELGQALQVRHGFAFRGEHFRDSGELIVMTPGNFHDEGGFKAKSGKEKYYDGPVPPGYLLSRGDVVVVMTEQTPGLLGSTATIPVSGRYLHNQRLGLLRVTDPGKLDLRFCYHLLNAPAVRHQIQATATGSKVRHTAPERIRSVRVALPNLRIQQTAAGILDALDGLIENNRRRIEVLEQVAQASYREWFVRFRYPGHEGGRLVDSPLGPIPKGWQVMPLAAMVSLGRTTIQPHRSPDEMFDHYSIPAFDDRRLPAMDAGDTIRSGKFLLTDRAVLVSKLNPRIERTWLVEPTATRRSVASTEFLILRPMSGISLEFLYLLIRASSFQERLRELSGGTSTSHQRAKPDDFVGIPVIAPPSSLLTRALALVAPQLQMARTLRLKIRELETMRDLLLPKLVTGQIDVSKLFLDGLVDSVA